jgi:peroxiredoxin
VIEFPKLKTNISYESKNQLNSKFKQVESIDLKLICKIVMEISFSKYRFSCIAKLVKNVFSPISYFSTHIYYFSYQSYHS